jgi:Fe-S cluster assembly ATP-binding protein
MKLLEIKNLHVSIHGKEIIHGLNLTVNEGEVHAIMGPNGTGKSTLALAIAGKEGYDITEGEVMYKGQVINDMLPEERARLGIFLGFQYPVEIPGVSLTNFMRTALNEIREYRGLPQLGASEFLKMMEEKKNLVEIQSKLTNRSVNEGFSGGEKKKNEIFQMAMLEPYLAVLDETDSGLDIDALKIVANGVNMLKKPENATIVITHYQRLLQYIVPDFVHVMYEGKIVRSGGKELAVELEEKGYEWTKDLTGL